MEYSTSRNFQDVFCYPMINDNFLEKVKSEIETRDSEIIRLKKENAMITHQKETVDSECNKLQKQVSSLKQEKQESDDIITALRNELKSTNLHVEKLETEIDEGRETKKVMKENIKMISEKVMIGNQYAQVLEEELIHFKRQIDKQTLSTKDYHSPTENVSRVDKGMESPYNEYDIGPSTASLGSNFGHQEDLDESAIQYLKRTVKVICEKIDEDLIQNLTLIQTIIEKDEHELDSFSEDKLTQLLKFWNDPVIAGVETRINRRELQTAVRKHLLEHENQNKGILIYTHENQTTTLGRSQNIAQYDNIVEEKMSER